VTAISDSAADKDGGLSAYRVDLPGSTPA